MKRNLFLFVGVVLILGYYTTILRSEEPSNDERFKTDFQQKLDTLCKAEGFPGVTAAVIFPDGKSMTFASGLADSESKQPMKPSDRMFSGSIGKTYCAVVALQLMQEQKLALDDKVSRFLGKERWFHRLPNANDLTVKMIMTHTGGLPRYVLKEKLWAQINLFPNKVWTPAERLAFILDEKPVHPAGQGWAYSDTDFIILGMIIEKVTGHSYYEELSQRVLKPHNLNHTSPSIQRDLPGLVPGYTGDHVLPFNLPAKMVKKGRYVINPQFEWTGGGLITNAEDLARFNYLLMNGKLLSEKSMALMTRAVNEKTGQPAEEGYGLGLEIWNTPEGLVYGHRGTMPGYLSIMQFYHRYHFAIAIQINTDGLSGKLDKKKDRTDYINALIPVIIDTLDSGSEGGVVFPGKKGLIF